MLKKALPVFLAIVASVCSAQQYKVSEYLEGGDFEYHKWLGSKTKTHIVWEFQPYIFQEATWKLNWYVGEDGDFTGLPPYTWKNNWFWETKADGTANEVGDWIEWTNESNPQNLQCLNDYLSGNAIKWGKAGGMAVGDFVDGPIIDVGTCLGGWGYSELDRHYSTFTLPATTRSADGSSCAASTFTDVIKIVNYQWFCTNGDPNGNCSTWKQFHTDFFLAKDFGFIRFDAYQTVDAPKWQAPATPKTGTFYLRRLCNGQGCQCPTQNP